MPLGFILSMIFYSDGHCTKPAVRRSPADSADTHGIISTDFMKLSVPINFKITPTDIRTIEIGTFYKPSFRVVRWI